MKVAGEVVASVLAQQVVWELQLEVVVEARVQILAEGVVALVQLLEEEEVEPGEPVQTMGEVVVRGCRVTEAEGRAHRVGEADERV